MAMGMDIASHEHARCRDVIVVDAGTIDRAMLNHGMA
jgi:hypothetical protein